MNLTNPASSKNIQVRLRGTPQSRASFRKRWPATASQLTPGTGAQMCSGLVPSSARLRSACCQHRRSEVPNRLLFSHSSHSKIVNYWARTYRIDALEESVTQDIERILTTALNAAIDVARLGLCEPEVLLLDGKLLVTHGKGDSRQLVRRGVARVNISLAVRIIGSPRNGVVDGLDGLIIHKGESGTCVGNGLVPRARDGLAIDSSRGGVELPEALAVVHRGVIDPLALDYVLVDVAKSVERLALVGIILVAPRTQVGREELGRLRDLILRDHVLDRRLDSSGLDRVDVTPGEAQQTVS